MIIYIEGLSCAGKTELIGLLKNFFGGNNIFPDKNILCVSEISGLPNDYNKNLSKKEINNKKCLISDEIKSEVAHSFIGDLVLVDRGYVSTLAYNYIYYSLKINNDFSEIESWYKENIGVSLRKPDVYLYVEISPATSIQRAKSIGRYTKKYAWYLDPQKAIDYYCEFFRTIEPDVPVIFVNGESAIEKVFEEAKEKLLTFIDKKMG